MMPRLARLVSEHYPSYISRLLKGEERSDSVSRKPVIDAREPGGRAGSDDTHITEDEEKYMSNV